MTTNDNKNNLWGSDNQTPPELDKVIKDFKDKFSSVIGGNSNSGAENKLSPTFGGLKYILFIIILLWIASGIYIIDPAEKGVVLRFGAFQEENSQGPHWHIPYPIESVIKVNVDQIRPAEIGFRTNQKNRFSNNVFSESLMLTRDENIVDAKFSIQYKVNSAKDYLFNISNPDNTLRGVVESAIRLVVGKDDMDYLFENRTVVSQSIKEKSQALLDSYQSGLEITTVNMKDAQPPEQVQAAFDDAVKAREDRQRLINEAETYSNGVLPQARGESARMLQEAEAYKSKVISKSEGEAVRFSKILGEYKKAPAVTKERLYRETMEIVLFNTSKVVVDSKANSMMYLPIDKLLENRQQNTAESGAKTTKSEENKQGGIRNVFRNREVR
ncbi:MAG: FtsH protease activity modulator HflK [Candidatus Thioglobus sp.]|nr:MAG: FtsH protease activity modulator HflK [Candidatus Thioglobus sp.]